MHKLLTALSVSLLLACTAASCAHAPPEPLAPAPEEETVLIKRSTLDMLLQELITTKRELLECLGR